MRRLCFFISWVFCWKFHSDLNEAQSDEAVRRATMALLLVSFIIAIEKNWIWAAGRGRESPCPFLSFWVYKTVTFHFITDPSIHPSIQLLSYEGEMERKRTLLILWSSRRLGHLFHVQWQWYNGSVCYAQCFTVSFLHPALALRVVIIFSFVLGRAGQIPSGVDSSASPTGTQVFHNWTLQGVAWLPPSRQDPPSTTHTHTHAFSSASPQPLHNPQSPFPLPPPTTVKSFIQSSGRWRLLFGEYV